MIEWTIFNSFNLCSFLLVISSTCVLTAGHCIYASFVPTIIVGSKVLIHDSYYESDAAIHETRKDLIFLHEKYNYTGLVNDIAIIKLIVPVTLTPSVIPASIPPTNKLYSYNNVALHVTGFGKISLIDDREFVCLNYMENNGTQAGMCASRTSVMKFCALIKTYETEDGYRSPSACFGDSGGGTYKKNTNELLGVNSAVSGADCTGSNTFVRIAYYRDWILSVCAPDVETTSSQSGLT